MTSEPVWAAPQTLREPDPRPAPPSLTLVFTVLSEGGERKEFRTVEGVSLPAAAAVHQGRLGGPWLRHAANTPPLSPGNPARVWNVLSIVHLRSGPPLICRAAGAPSGSCCWILAPARLSSPPPSDQPGGMSLMAETQSVCDYNASLQRPQRRCFDWENNKSPPAPPAPLLMMVAVCS